MKIAAITLVLFLAGCSTMSNKPEPIEVPEGKTVTITIEIEG